MGFSLFGDSGSSSSQYTDTRDQSQNQVTSTERGASVQGNSGQLTITNNTSDSGLVSMGLENNRMAGSVLSHIADVTTATIGKLSDTIKQTSNDTLQASIGNSTVQAQTNNTAKSLFANLSENIQTIVAIGAVGLGAWYFLKKGK